MRKHLRAPVRVGLSLTNKCNLRCIHCYALSGCPMPNELGTEEWKNVIDELEILKVFEIVLTGGEPLLREDFFKIAEYILSKKFFVMLSTNGTLISNHVAKKLRDIGFKYIQVSLDAPYQEVNDSIRGKGVFKKVLNAIKYLTSNDIKVTIGMTILKYNYIYVEDMIKFAIKNSVYSVNFIDFVPAGRATIDMSLPFKDQLKLAHKIHKLSKKWKDEMIIVHTDPLSIHVINRAKSIPHKLREIFVGCEAGKWFCEIDPEGYVLPCPLFHGINEFVNNEDNVRKYSFEYIWKNSKILNMFRSLEVEEPCKNCQLFNYCRGWCRYKAYVVYGRLTAPYPLCPLLTMRSLSW